MKKFLIAVLLLATLIAGALGFFIIRSFNAENFQKQVIQGVTEATGRSFTIKGSTKVSWFPIPTIVLNDVVLTNQPDSPRAVMLQAERISVQIDWQSMLSSPLEIKHIDIEKPIVYLEKLPNGSKNWIFPFFKKKEIALDDNMMGGNSTGPQMKINVIRLKKGTIEFMDSAMNFGFTLTDVTGNVDIETINGPFTFSGNAQINKQPFNFSTKIDQYILGTPTHFTSDLKSKTGEVQINLDGTITHESAESDLNANATFTVKKPSEFLNIFEKQLPDTKLDVPTDGSFSIELRPTQDLLKNFIVRFGDKEGDLTVTGDLTRSRPNGKLAYSGGLAVNTLDMALAKRLWGTLNINPFKPEDVPDVDLTLNAQQIQSDKYTISGFDAKIQSQNGEITIPKLHAVLPANTSIDITAKSIIVEGKTGFETTIKGQSDNLTTVLNAFDIQNPFSQNTLQRTTVDGEAKFFTDAAQIDIKSAKVDNTPFSGAISWKKGEKRPLVTLTLKASNLNADTYFGYKATEKKEDLAKTVLAAQNYLKNNKKLISVDSTFDVDITDFTFRSLPIAQLKTNGTISDGTLRIATLEAMDMATAQMQASGLIAGIGTDKLSVQNGELSFSADQLPLFLQRANINPGFHFVQQVSGTAFRVNASLANGTWDLTTQGRIGDLSGRLTGKITPAENQAVYRDFSLDIAHPSFQQLLKNVLPDAQVNKALSGSFKMRGTLNGTAQDFQITKTSISIGTQHLSGDISFKEDAAKILKANITAGSIDGQKMFPEFLKKALVFAPKSKQEFNFSALDNWDIALSVVTDQLLYNTIDLKKTKIKLTVKDKVLTLTDLSGQQGGESAPVKATATLSWADVPTFKTTVELKNVPLNPNFLMIDNKAFGGGTISVKASLSGTGKNPEELIKALQGNGSFNVKNAQFVGANIAQVPALVQSALQTRKDDATFKTQINQLLTTGKTALPPMSGTFTVKDGTVQSVDTKMVGDIFVSDPMQFTWAAPERTLDIFVPISLTRYPNLPPFALTAKGSLGQMAYQENATDLSAAINGMVGSALTVEKKQQEKVEAVQKKQEQSDRKTRMNQAIATANDAVKAAADKIYGDTNSEASYLLQTAKDAVQIVNELAIKENPTDAQYIQLMEQSRLAVLRANEAVLEMQKDAYFDERNQLLVYRQRGREIVSYLETLHVERPDIELVGKLVPAARSALSDLEAVAARALSDITPEENERLAEQANTLFAQLQRAYDYVQRFQLSEPVVPVSGSIKRAVEEPTEKKGIKGKISR